MKFQRSLVTLKHDSYHLLSQNIKVWSAIKWFPYSILLTFFFSWLEIFRIRSQIRWTYAPRKSHAGRIITEQNMTHFGFYFIKRHSDGLPIWRAVCAAKPHSAAWHRSLLYTPRLPTPVPLFAPRHNLSSSIRYCRVVELNMVHIA